MQLNATNMFVLRRLKLRQRFYYNITITHLWCRAMISTSIKTSITHVPTPQKTTGTLFPLAIEELIAGDVRRVRKAKLPVFPDDMMAWATHLIKGTDYEQHFDEG
jgi:hypothetical protein